MIGYTKVDVTADFTDLTSSSNQDVGGEFTMKALTIRALISKKFSVLTLYGGVGINSVKSSLKMKGDFEVDVISGLAPVIVSDPVNLSFKAGGPKLTTEFRLKFAILTIHADYTLQKYSSLNNGSGFCCKISQTQYRYQNESHPSRLWDGFRLLPCY